ncbi:MAG: aminoglycoside 6-adenylyltransferase [Anaerolineae bacterium]|nr:aminoglycoside 6-adenylyltransferase [Anaerolineae bacterium]MCI0609150.1 aminoglycoside 6-adenylyltransferase [Anaerolineae bacterium]
MMQLQPNHQVMMDRFITACQADDRVAAALHVGSYVKGLADAHSDLDLYLITTDDDYKDFITDRSAFIRGFGEPLFMEDFDLPDILFLIFPDGSEVEVPFGRESQLSQILNEPYKVLLDKKNITAGITPSEGQVNEKEQTEKLRRLIYWFWHELSHFTTALARKQLWWAHGQLGALRLYCINLVRLQNNFLDQDIGEEGYFKIEDAILVEQLSVLKATYCPMEENAMLESAEIIVRFFRDIATGLATRHGITYPERLDKVMVERLEKLRYGR